ncbi:protein phosphatase 2C domain-containing protein [uncultured Hyphomonas sp.]|uniref:PP2C family protein-serine/threonine phosphatase n=1 Tax=uncultured Hyphomonas sp. TaxID=225298 RepID=UPI002AAAD729|nr:protein phosphatase 2C domain-containing protein [uncultured Hyphomonas sp.]
MASTASDLSDNQGPVFAHRQHQGKRPYQEDQIGFQDNGDVSTRLPAAIVLADGMGGHVGGRQAATIAVSTYLDHVSAKGVESIRAREKDALFAANEAIKAKVAKAPEMEGMGCTLVGLSIVGSQIRWISVGDSPLWLIDGDRITRLNQDHSMAGAYADMVADGQMTEEEARNAPRRNALRSAVSGGAIDMIDHPEDWITAPPGAVVVLASDGLDTLSPSEIVSVVKSAPTNAEAISQKLIDNVLHHDRKNQDNVTVAVILMPGGSDRDPRHAETLVKPDARKPSSVPPVPESAGSSVLPGWVWTVLAIVAAVTIAVLAWVAWPRSTPPPSPDQDLQPETSLPVAPQPSTELDAGDASPDDLATETDDQDSTADPLNLDDEAAPASPVDTAPQLQPEDIPGLDDALPEPQPVEEETAENSRTSIQPEAPSD